MHVNAHKVTCGNSGPVKVKGGMSLRNGMWHGLRNDIIMRNLIYGNGAKIKNSKGRHAGVSAAPFLTPI